MKIKLQYGVKPPGAAMKVSMSIGMEKKSVCIFPWGIILPEGSTRIHKASSLLRCFSSLQLRQTLREIWGPDSVPLPPDGTNGVNTDSKKNLKISYRART